MTATGLPFDDIRSLASQLPELNEGAAGRVRGLLARPENGLGGIEELAAWFARATGREPRITRPVVALFSSTHGITRHLGIADPVAEARAGVEDIAAGAAPISQYCAASNLGLNVFDLALEIPVGDITEEAALDERGCAATMAFGMEAMALGADLICLDVLGNAADWSAMAVLSALQSSSGEEWEEAALEQSGPVVRALHTHRGHLRDPLETVRRLGGREIAALAGAILAARTQNVAVILNGLPATAAAAALHALNPRALEHCLLAAAMDEQHREAALRIGLSPVLGPQMAGRDGMAGAVVAGIVRSAGEVAAGMAEVNARRG